MVSDDLGVNIAYAATFNDEQDVYFLRLGSYDCNANGIPDEDDIAGGSSEDCDANHIPDECDPDCNGNGAPDACDIAEGIAYDKDGNGIPDECEDVILFVDGAATGANDGSSWEDAYNDLQDAIMRAQVSRGLVTEIWVAAGIYKPDRGTGNPVGSFRLVSGVGIYGGFSGVETAPDQRDPTGNPTILSGDLNGDDDPDETGGDSDCCDEHPTPGCTDPVCEAAVCEYHPECCELEWDRTCRRSADRLCCTVCNDRPTRCDNSHHVIATSGNDPTAVLDGFTVTGGIPDILLSGMETADSGGGLWNLGGSPTIINCTFVHNSGFHGGASFNVGGAPTFLDCTFSNNSALSGGAIRIQQGDTMWPKQNAGIRNCGERPVLINCGFFDNLASEGGGLYNAGSALIMENCTFSGNLGGEGGAMYNTDAILDNRAFGDPMLYDCTFSGNSADDGGGLYNEGSSPTLNDCTFRNNSADGGGGAIYNTGGDPRLNDCTFSGNLAGSAGGGLRNRDGSPTLTDCVFSGNSANIGGGMSNRSSDPMLLNCTFTGNSAESNGGGLQNRFESAPLLGNSILWANMDSTGTGESAQIYDSDGLGANSPVVRYSCIQGLTGVLGGVGNIGDDPLFVDAEGPDGIPGTEDDDLRLMPSSPGVNTGDPAFILEPGETDLAGQPRLQGCRVDMGAYETDVLQSHGDFDSDLDFDLADFAYLQVCFRAGEGDPLWLDACLCGFDFDGNDDVDIGDFAAFVQDFDGPH
jgi:predicted outer membrane repeat protein